MSYSIFIVLPAVTEYSPNNNFEVNTSTNLESHIGNAFLFFGICIRCKHLSAVIIESYLQETKQQFTV